MIDVLVLGLLVCVCVILLLLSERFSLKRKIRFRDKWIADNIRKSDARHAEDSRLLQELISRETWSIDCLSTDETPTDPLLNALLDAYRCGKTINRRNNWAALNRDFKERFGKDLDEWDEPEEMAQSTERSLALLELLGSNERET